MMLDMRTILVVTGILDCIIVVTTWAVHHSHKKHYKGTIDWFLCFFLNTLGNLLLASRGFLPDILSIVIAHTLMTLSICYLVRACALVSGFSSSVVILVIPPVLFFIFHLSVGIFFPSLFIRALGSTAMSLAGSVWASTYLWRAKTRGARSGFCFLTLMSLSLVFRLCTIISTHYQGNWIDNAPVDTWFMLIFLIVYIGLGFSYLRIIDGMAMDELSASSESNKLLFKEMRHRTKNNLALISSLVSLQSDSVSDPDARAAFSVLESRLRTISSVYRMLSTTTPDQRADVKAYLSSIITGIRDSLVAGRKITFSTQIESLDLGQNLLVPLGLIVNELVTNAAKYAFPGDRAGSIGITFEVEGKSCRLTVCDDGIGLPEGAASGKGIGLSLVTALAGQLRGTVQFGGGAKNRATVSAGTPGAGGTSCAGGTTCAITFPIPA